MGTRRSTEALVGYWDRQAPAYDREMAGVERRYLAASRGWVAARAHGATLEVAAGTGATFPHYPGGVTLTAVDWSAAMVREAGRRAQDLGLTVDLRQASATALPFASGSFDSVVCTFALCCIPDVGAALREAVRVLRPGGDLLLADHVAASFWPLRAAQHVLDLVTVPLHGEHYTRRPLTTLRALDVDVVAAERLRLGAIERVHARTRA